MTNHIDAELADFIEDFEWEERYLRLMQREEDMIVNSSIQDNERLAEWIKNRDPVKFTWPKVI